MNYENPQFSPAEYGMTTADFEEAPDLQHSIELTKAAEDIEVVAPDIEPPIINEDGEVLSRKNKDVEYIEPEFSPPGMGILEYAEEEFVVPKEQPMHG